MSFIGHRVLRPVLLHYFRSIFTGKESGDVRFAYGVEVLKGLSLIQYEPASPTRHYIIIHPFTQEILAQEFDSHLDEIIPRIYLISQTPAHPSKDPLNPMFTTPLDEQPGELIYSEFSHHGNSALEN